MCLKTVRTVRDDRIAGWKVFEQMPWIPIFKSLNYAIDTSIILQKIGPCAFIEYTRNGLYLEAGNGEFYRAGIHIFRERGTAYSYDLILQVVSGNSEIYLDDSQACSANWVVKKAIYQNKEYRYLVLIKAMRKFPKFEIHDFWTIGNSKKEIRNNIKKFKKDVLFKDFKVIDVMIADLK